MNYFWSNINCSVQLWIILFFFSQTLRKKAQDVYILNIFIFKIFKKCFIIWIAALSFATRHASFCLIRFFFLSIFMFFNYKVIAPARRCVCMLRNVTLKPHDVNATYIQPSWTFLFWMINVLPLLYIVILVNMCCSFVATSKSL